MTPRVGGSISLYIYKKQKRMGDRSTLAKGYLTITTTTAVYLRYTTCVTRPIL